MWKPHVTAEDRPRLSALPVAELLDRARQYRAMAETATTAEQCESLLRLAWRFEKLALEKHRTC